MTGLLDVHLEEWPNGWSVRISGYLDGESRVFVTFKQAIRYVTNYQRKAYRAYMRDNPMAKIAK